MDKPKVIVRGLMKPDDPLYKMVIVRPFKKEEIYSIISRACEFSDNKQSRRASLSGM